ncbi:Hypothetical predicted protein [Lecanosticta acicola]|uniref:Uncharacterized protein n=1 Tax=Lecanosticta acicola TaxID=111012 RepID=A0AAI8W0D4_9PEZI|nr:Hypothetical predicted protein [Lecanosticta acicola]
MAAIPKLFLLSLVSLAVAGLPGANIEARQASSCSGNDLLGYQCFPLGPSSYATSYCSGYPPQGTSTVTSTPTVTVTATTNVATIFDPTTTITVTSLAYENTTLNATDFQTVTTVAIAATTTVTVTALTSATLTTQGATTETDEATSQATVTSTEFVTQSIPPFVSGTTTVTVTSTTVVTSPSPIPSGFRLFTNYTDGSTAYADNIRIGSGYEIIFTNDTTTPGDPFYVNSTGQLLNDGLFAAVAAEAENYVIPFVFLLPNAAPRPGTFLLSFSVCNGVLQASRAGGGGGGGGGETYVSGLCTVDGNAVLAIGSATSFPSNATCALVTLYLEGGSLPTSGAVTTANPLAPSTVGGFSLPLLLSTSTPTDFSTFSSLLGTGTWPVIPTPTLKLRHKKLRRVL